MAIWVALFRGINVGGKNIVPMAELRSELEAVGLQSVRSYIQSGNVVFESKLKSANSLSKLISDCVEENRGFRPAVLILNSNDLQKAIDSNPFQAAASEPGKLHCFFLSKAAKLDSASVEKAQAQSETCKLVGKVFYLHAPDGIGRSKLAANAEKYLGVPVTARNFRTVLKIAELATG